MLTDQSEHPPDVVTLKSQCFTTHGGSAGELHAPPPEQFIYGYLSPPTPLTWPGIELTSKDSA